MLQKGVYVEPHHMSATKIQPRLLCPRMYPRIVARSQGIWVRNPGIANINAMELDISLFFSSEERE